MTPDPVELMDVTSVCADTGWTEAQVRRALREAVSAGYLKAEVTDTEVVLTSTFPTDNQPKEQRHG